MMMYDNWAGPTDPRDPRNPKKPGAKKPAVKPASPVGGPIAPPVLPGNIPPAVVGGWQNQQNMGGMLNVGNRMSGQALGGLLNFKGIPSMYGSGPFFGNIPGGMDPMHMDKLINAQFLRSLGQPANPWLPAPMNLAAFAAGNGPNDDPKKKNGGFGNEMMRY